MCAALVVVVYCQVSQVCNPFFFFFCMHVLVTFVGIHAVILDCDVYLRAISRHKGPAHRPIAGVQYVCYENDATVNIASHRVVTRPNIYLM